MRLTQAVHTASGQNRVFTISLQHVHIVRALVLACEVNTHTGNATVPRGFVTVNGGGPDILP